jgi:CRISPR-associated protein Cas2
MSRPDHLFVFAYDVERDSQRRKLADLLDDQMDRVQMSVFEGRMTRDAAQLLARRASVHLGLRDSLRVYCITEAGLQNCIVHGAGVLPEADDFVLI